MGSEIVAFEGQLRPLSTHFEQALAGVMPVDRLIRTALISAERNPNLLQCDRQSFLNTIMSAGVLGLEMDGVTGQAFPIPFKNKVQLVIGYKGYNTLAARAGITITGEVVREGDKFDYDLGEGWIKHKTALGNKSRIVAAWSKASALDRPPIVTVLSIDEIMAIKDRSPGARKGDSPWNDPAIGFPAMASKSAKRRLARSTPLTVMTIAARMEEAFEEQGRHSFIAPSGQLVIEGESSPIAQTERNETPSVAALISPKAEAEKAEILRDLLSAAETIARGGVNELRDFWKNRLTVEEQHLLASDKDRLKRAAEEADRAAATI